MVTPIAAVILRRRAAGRAKHVAILFLVFAMPAVEQGCWSHGFSEERCCQEGPDVDGCFQADRFMTRYNCCDREGNTTDLLFAGKRFVTLLRLIWMAVDCLVYSRAHDCEVKFLESIGGISPGKRYKEWLESTWKPRASAHGVLDRGRALRLALALAEAPLLWRVEKLAVIHQWYSWDYFGKLHIDASRQLHQLITHSSAQSWVDSVRFSFQSWSQGGDQSEVAAGDEVVHIAMIASAGQPPFGAKAMAGIRSALFFAKKLPIQFHLFVDEQGEEDMRLALERLEPWLSVKASFVFYGERTLSDFFKLLRSKVPLDCLGSTSHFGDVGFLRLFVHEVMVDTGVELLIFVDAGDYVFLEDPAEMLKHRSSFGERHVAGGAVGESLPLQLFDLPRMRQSSWTERVVFWVNRLFYYEAWPEACTLGEGYIMREMSNEEFWYNFEAEWCFEPHEYWLEGEGWKNVWSYGGSQWQDAVWKERVYPGVEDWTSLRVFCPSVTQSYVYTNFAYEIPPPLKHFTYAQELSMHRDMENFANATLSEALVYDDARAFSLTCNHKVLGVHFIAGLKGVPWVRKFLNYWTGNGAWGSDSQDYMKRSLLKAVES